MFQRERVVIKVGGSLLSFPTLAERLQTWINQRPDSFIRMVIGGGPFADSIRSLQKIHHFNNIQSHQLAIEAMGLSQVLVAKLLDDIPILSIGSNSLDLWKDGSPRVALIDHRYWLQEPSECLPNDWNVTSDSLAAWVAVNSKADRLVWAKSVGPPSSLVEAGAKQWVDTYLSTQLIHPLQTITIDWWNLRTGEYRSWNKK